MSERVSEAHLVSEGVATGLGDVAPEVSRHKAFALLVDDKDSRRHGGRGAEQVNL